MSKSIHGIGLGLRRQFADEILDTTRRIDFLEITPENWVCYGGKLRALCERAFLRWPTLSHGVSLSIGGLDPLDDEFLAAIAALCERLDAPFWSDHLCYSTVQGQPVHDLLPLPFTREAVAHTARRIAAVQHRVGAPLVLENATFYAHMPDAEMDEADFLCAVLEAADCGMLLDVNNVYVNSVNHGFDPQRFIDRMPIERVRQLHMAGHTRKERVVIDTHIGPIIPAVWDLYRYTLRRAGRLIPTVIEWDQDIPPLAQVLDEVDRARAVAAEVLGPAALPAAPAEAPAEAPVRS